MEIWFSKKAKKEIVQEKPWNFKEYTEHELQAMTHHEFAFLKSCIRFNCWNMLGFTKAREVRYWYEQQTGSLHFQWR